MRKSLVVLSVAGLVSSCGQTSDNSATANQAIAAKPEKKPAYCFFKDGELKGWTAKRGKDGNITVKGTAHVSDPRYKAMLNPATVNGTSAELAPTIGQNDTGYGAKDDTWDLSATIPNSSAVATVTVSCGDKTAATMSVPPKG